MSRIPPSFRRWFIVALLCPCLLLGGTAQAKRRSSVAFFAAGITVGALGLASLGIAAGLYYGAPGASTLGLYERYNNVSSDMVVPGVIGLLLGAPLTVLGSIMLVNDQKRDAQSNAAHTTNLWIAPAGAGMALGGQLLMRSLAMLTVGLGALLLCGAGCDELVYSCQNDASCVVLGVQGRCLSAGTASYCAFPFQPTSALMTCPSDLRWDTSAPMEIEGTCVVLPTHDGGVNKDGP